MGVDMQQLTLPMDLPKLSRPIAAKAMKRATRIVVEEIRTPDQDFHILELSEGMKNDMDLDEHYDVDAVLMTCIRIRTDVDRKHVNMFIAYDEGKPIGFLLGVTSQAFHRQGIVAEQKLWYVKPIKRHSLAALCLLKAYESWARLNGATQIFTGTANKRYAERTSKFFEQTGYARVGSLHVKEI